MTTRFCLALFFLSSVPFATAAPDAIPLWPNGAPGSEGKTAKEVLTGTQLSSIHNPSITPFLPSKEKATGAAVIVAPGGGHRFLSIENEGNEIGRAHV